MKITEQIESAANPEQVEEVVKNVAIRFVEWYDLHRLESYYVNLTWEQAWDEFKAEYDNDHTH